MKNDKIATIRAIHKQIKSDYVKNELIVIALEIMCVFLLLQFVTIFIPTLQQNIGNTPLRLSFTISGTISILFGVIRLFIKSKRFKIAKVQRKLEHLDELYATVLELQNSDTLPALAAQEEFIEKAKNTSTYPLFEYKRLYARSGILLFLLILLFFTPFFGSISTIDTTWIDEIIQSNRLKDIFVQPDNITLLSDEGIYGDETTLVSGTANLEITLDRTTSGGDYANPLAWQNNVRDSGSRFSETVDARIDSPAIEKLPEEFELAKAYNLKIRQIE